MKKGKYAKGGVGAKALILVLTVALLVGVSVGGTLAWLTDKSEVVTNTFTDSDINITLEETKTDFKMIPGWTIDKDPVVTVEAGSEDCYVFLKVEEKHAALREDEVSMPMVIGAFGDFIAYAIDGVGQENDGWTALPGEEGIYYRKVEKSDSDQEIKVLAAGSANVDGVKYTWGDNQVLVMPTVTKEMMNLIDGVDADGKTNTAAAKAELDARPSLTFTAYAVQLWKNNTTEFTPAEAWANAQNVENQQTGTTSGT